MLCVEFGDFWLFFVVWCFLSIAAVAKIVVNASRLRVIGVGLISRGV